MAAKRFCDLFLTTLLVVLLAPIIVFLFAALAADFLLKREDRGAYFYRETRVSQGREFELLKFRTLRTEVLADMRRNEGHARLYEADPANLTWAGRRLLKPRYLDELPQLVNVFRGEMSLVGPRPWPPAMVERQIAAGLDYRIRIPAGLTGPAQVTKGGDLRYEDLDTEYLERIESLSSWGLVRYDLQILRRTLGTIARGEGLNF